METQIIKINPKEIKLLDLNARYMEKDEYSKLVNNIKKDKKLTSVPFCFVNDDNQVEVLSGNHRVMASIDAELEEIEVMLCREKLTKDQQIALQLSHNSIVGKDDDKILMSLYKQIESFDYKEYSGLTDEFLAFCKENENLLNSPDLKYQILNLMFLPSEIDEIKKVMSDLGEYITKEKILIANYNDYDTYLQTTTDLSKCMCVKNSATVFLALIKLAQNHAEDLKEICFNNTKDNDYVPISTLIGRTDVKKEYAVKLDKAIETMLSKGIIKKQEKDKVFAILAESYFNNK